MERPLRERLSRETPSGNIVTGAPRPRGRAAAFRLRWASAARTCCRPSVARARLLPSVARGAAVSLLLRTHASCGASPGSRRRNSDKRNPASRRKLAREAGPVVVGSVVVGVGYGRSWLWAGFTPKLGGLCSDAKPSKRARACELRRKTLLLSAYPDR